MCVYIIMLCVHVFCVWFWYGQFGIYRHYTSRPSVSLRSAVCTYCTHCNGHTSTHMLQFIANFQLKRRTSCSQLRSVSSQRVWSVCRCLWSNVGITGGVRGKYQARPSKHIMYGCTCTSASCDFR